MTKSEREEREAYRSVFFSTPEGKSVFSHIITTLGYFNTVDNEQERIRRNVAVWLLSMTGVTEGASINHFISNLVDIPLYEGLDVGMNGAQDTNILGEGR